MGVKNGLFLIDEIIDGTGTKYTLITANLAIPFPFMDGARWLRYESVVKRKSKKGVTKEFLVERYETRSEAERQHKRIIEAVKKGVKLQAG